MKRARRRASNPLIKNGVPPETAAEAGCANGAQKGWLRPGLLGRWERLRDLIP